MGGLNGISGREVQYNAEISRRVEQLRVNLGVRKTELALAADVSPQQLRAYEVGTSRWPVFRVRLIAEYLRVSVEQLMPKSKSYVKKASAARKLFVG